MVQGTGLEPVCHIADGAEEMRSTVLGLYGQPLQAEDIRSRKVLLSGLYNQEDNLDRLLRSIWSDEKEIVEK
jgi:hypothetical protein